MAGLKTKPTASSVGAFLDTIDNEERRCDCRALVKLMKDVTGAPPRMWGTSNRRLRQLPLQVRQRTRGRLVPDRLLAAQAGPDALHHVGFERAGGLLERLGRHRTGKSCLYVKRLADLDVEVLRQLVQASTAYLRTGT
jgi:hypothetical protein